MRMVNVFAHSCQVSKPFQVEMEDEQQQRSAFYLNLSFNGYHTFSYIDVLNRRLQKQHQKMEVAEKNACESPEAMPICVELNLDLQRLADCCLQESPIYRRLCNIVKNDMSRSDLHFRKNLIKQLYFLLSMAPVIKEEHLQHFLGEVQKWYNLNDHKKIDLASNKLNNLLDIVNKDRKDTIFGGLAERPKSGVSWNKNVSPFLRPYTAQRPVRERPQSPKTKVASTRADSMVEDIYIRECKPEPKEELEISQDFINRHRTSHPQYQPVYEQLQHILKKVQTKPEQEESTPENPKKKYVRYSKSAVPQRHTVIIEEARQVPEGEEEGQDGQVDIRDVDDESSADGSEGEDSDISERGKAPFKAWCKSIRVLQKQKEDIEKQDFSNLNKYQHLLSNKLTKGVHEQRQIAQKHVDYTRNKSAMRREMNRKIESKRMLSAKPTISSSYKTVKRADKQNKDNSEDDFKVHDLTKDPLCQQPDVANKYPTYNRREFLNNRYHRPISSYRKRNPALNLLDSSNDGVATKAAGPPKRPMTACVRFNSPTFFDPLSADNVKQYNSEVLQEIEKVKLKMGGKNSASTQALMRALMIDLEPEPVSWQTRNPTFNMLSTGKKLKKKGRKLLKSKNKVTKKTR